MNKGVTTPGCPYIRPFIRVITPMKPIYFRPFYREPHVTPLKNWYVQSMVSLQADDGYNPWKPTWTLDLPPVPRHERSPFTGARF